MISDSAVNPRLVLITNFIGDNSLIINYSQLQGLRKCLKDPRHILGRREVIETQNHRMLSVELT